jgi:hypothetical protein
MLLIIGGRYLTFPSLYGLPACEVLGASLAVAAMALAMAGMSMVAGAMTGSVIGYVFGGIIFSRARTHAA